MAGPLLKELFDKAFIEGLHAPEKRPSAADWESALVRTLDMIQPCSAKCEMGWYVFDNTRLPVCPHCGTPYRGKLPVLNLYSSRTEGHYHPDNHRLMVWDGQSLFPWHANRNIFPNEHLEDRHKRRVGYFQFHNGDWHLVNEGLNGMKDVTRRLRRPHWRQRQVGGWRAGAIVERPGRSSDPGANWRARNARRDIS